MESLYSAEQILDLIRSLEFKDWTYRRLNYYLNEMQPAGDNVTRETLTRDLQDMLNNQGAKS